MSSSKKIDSASADAENLIEGKVFRTYEGEEFGILRATNSSGPDDLKSGGWIPFAEDGCGNFFACRHDSSVFWDHKTVETLLLAVGEERFLAGICDPSPVELNAHQVKSAWIDPDFARNLGEDPDVLEPPTE